MDIITYSLLKKKIASALTGISNVQLSGSDTLVFTTIDGATFSITIPMPDLIYVGDTQPPADSHYELWIDTSVAGMISAGGSGESPVLSESLTATVNIGSIKSGTTYPAGTDLETIIREMLVTYLKPTITIGINPTKTLYNLKNESLSSLKISANVTKKSENIEYIKYYVNNSLVNTINTGVDNGGVFSYNHTFNTPVSQTFTTKVECRDINTHSVVSASTTVSFINECYAGVIEDGTAIDATSVTALTPTLRAKVGCTNKYTASYGRFIYAYPASLGNITSIKDLVNNFTYTNSCETATMTLNGESYKVIYLKDPMGFTDVNITFA